MQFSDVFQRNHVIFDGAIGTMLLEAGLRPGASPDLWNQTNPEAVLAVHRAYLEAGADVIASNTFGCNAVRLKRENADPAGLAEAGMRLVRRAIAESGKSAFAAMDIGPLGTFIEPLGDLTEEEAEAMFRVPVEAGVAAGADLILIETMSSLTEALCAVRAAKFYGAGLPIVCSMTYNENGHIMTGETIETVNGALERAGVDVLGCNCGTGPDQFVAFLPRMRAAHAPVLMMPNAGLPVYSNGKTVYHVGAEEFAAKMRLLADGGIWGIGGCCGTTPAHISALVSATVSQPGSSR